MNRSVCGHTEWKESVQVFFIVWLYMYCCWRSSYQEGRVGILLTDLTSPHFCACPKTGFGFPTSCVVVTFLYSVKMRGDCLLCWYWWNWGPPLFKLSFHTLICVPVWAKVMDLQWFSADTPVSFNNKTDRQDIAEILLKVALNTISQSKPKVMAKIQPYHTEVQQCPITATQIIILYKRSIRGKRSLTST